MFRNCYISKRKEQVRKGVAVNYYVCKIILQQNIFYRSPL